MAKRSRRIAGRAESAVSENTLRVRYAETDAMGIVYHTNYIVWFETGRVTYMRERGHSYAELEARGWNLPVTEVEARFIAPARFDDVVMVRTRVTEVRSRSITFAYEVFLQETEQVLATGRTKHICVDGNGRVRPIPADLRAALMISDQEQ